MFIILLLVSVGSFESIPTCAESLCKAYRNALEITKTPKPDRVSKSLTAIRFPSDRLKFDEKGRVLLVTSSNSDYFPTVPGTEFRLLEQTWFTAYPDLEESCALYNTSNKSLRMQQQLGLPPVYEIKVITEVYVDMQNIFRPCPDPEISDMECQVSIQVVNNKNKNSSAPWYCPGPNEEIIQVSGAWTQVSRSHFDWMCKNWEASYENYYIYHNYPWTGLGYTYDWGSEDGYGLSEFVVPEGTLVAFGQKKTLDDYCKSN